MSTRKAELKIASPAEIYEALRKTKAAFEFDSKKPEYEIDLKRHARSFNVKVYPPSVDRALRLLKNMLIKAYTIGAVPKLQGTRYAIRYQGFFFKIQMREIVEAAWSEKYGYSSYEATGRLEIKISPPDWYAHRDSDDDLFTLADDESGKLESKVGNICEILGEMLKAYLQKEKEEAERAKIRAAEHDVWQFEHTKKEVAETNLKATLKAVRCWKRSREIAEFLAEADRRFERPRPHAINAWFEHCQSLVDTLNPFANGPKPWDEMVGMMIDGELRTFIQLKGLDPRKELAHLIEKHSSKGGRW